MNGKTRNICHSSSCIREPACRHPSSASLRSAASPRGKPRRHCRPGSPGWRPLPGSEAFGLQQPTGYHLFTIHSYLLLSPTQVGDAGRVRAPTYRYRVGSVSVCGTVLPCPWFPPCIKSGGLGHLCIGTGLVAALSVVTDDKKSLADWRDFSVCVGITYLPGKSPCKYCRRR